MLHIHTSGIWKANLRFIPSHVDARSHVLFEAFTSEEMIEHCTAIKLQSRKTKKWYNDASGHFYMYNIPNKKSRICYKGFMVTGVHEFNLCTNHPLLLAKSIRQLVGGTSQG